MITFDCACKNCNSYPRAVLINHCIHHSLPPERKICYNLRDGDHTRQLIVHKFQRTLYSFLVRMLFYFLAIFNILVYFVVYCNGLSACYWNKVKWSEYSSVGWPIYSVQLLISILWIFALLLLVDCKHVRLWLVTWNLINLLTYLSHHV